MKYPIGIQTFADLREEGYVYVDKTALVYKLVNEGRYYFLSRPRRFGKSLLLSTLSSYFEGRKELFEGLALERLETKWEVSPVLHLDLNIMESGNPESLNVTLDERLRLWEEAYGIKRIAKTPEWRFANVIRAACEKTGKKVAVLIDEYDKPMLSLMEQGKPADAVLGKLKAFYSVLKSEDKYIRFAMLTGVTRFSKVSVFSDLNNLRDISMDPRFAGICGISEKELREVFDEPVGELAAANNLTKEACYEELRRRYDGYRFVHDTPRIYNPFSVLNTLDMKVFSSYWFTTGTPSFLVDVIRRTEFDFTEGLKETVKPSDLADVDSIEYSPVPILFQSGYLTIKDYDPDFGEYSLDFPNQEVREGFMNYLLPRLSPSGQAGGKYVKRLVRAVRSGDTEGMVCALKALFDQQGNYMLYEGKSKERDFRNIVYMIFSFLDIYCSAELCGSHGRMDIVAETRDYVYIIELKLDRSAAEALRQIQEKGYAEKYAADRRRLVLLGLNFSTATNSIDDWAAL